MSLFSILSFLPCDSLYGLEIFLANSVTTLSSWYLTISRWIMCMSSHLPRALADHRALEYTIVPSAEFQIWKVCVHRPSAAQHREVCQMLHSIHSCADAHAHLLPNDVSSVLLDSQAYSCQLRYSSPFLFAGPGLFRVSVLFSLSPQNQIDRCTHYPRRETREIVNWVHDLRRWCCLLVYSTRRSNSPNWTIVHCCYTVDYWRISNCFLPLNCTIDSHSNPCMWACIHVSVPPFLNSFSIFIFKVQLFSV